VGTVNDGMILNFDFAPTFLDYAVVNTLDERPSSSFRSLMQVELAHLNVYRYRIHPVHHNIYDDSPYAQIQPN